MNPIEKISPVKEVFSKWSKRFSWQGAHGLPFTQGGHLRPANWGTVAMSNQAAKSRKFSFVLAMQHLFPFGKNQQKQKHARNMI